MPLTTNVDRLYASEAYVDLNDRQYKAMADQLTMVSKARLSDLEGRWSNTDVHKVERAIRAESGLAA